MSNKLMTHNFSKNQVKLDIQRSTFNINHNRLATANAGDLNVCYCEEVTPGDTFDLSAAALIRMATPIHPTMSNAYCDLHFYFVPNRLVWDHWEEFLGVNKDTFWAQPTSYRIPHNTVDSSRPYKVGDLAEQFGIPINKSGFTVNALPFRAYCLIYNYYWRDKNLQNPLAFITSDSGYNTGALVGHEDDLERCAIGGAPAKACKLSDVFTRALPSPQKGPAVGINLLSSAPNVSVSTNYIPVFTADSYTPRSDKTMEIWSMNANQAFVSGTALDLGIKGYAPNRAYLERKPAGDSGNTFIDDKLVPANLWVDLDDISSISINELRLAFATQRILEAQARAGCSYQELLAGVYGVNAGDSRLQMPEYLGGKHFNINMSQVIQTSETGSTSPQGNTAAYSLTYDKNIGFKKSFVEHGLVIGVYTIRTENLYQQGLPKLFTKKDRYDEYWPQLANIGEVGIKNKELFVTGTSTDEEVFGYQEAWYEYRYHPNEITGEFRSDYSASLDSWHYGLDFQSTPILGSDFIEASNENVARTLAVQNHSQFLCNFYFHNKATRPLPLYSIPGLIDHH